MSQLNWLVDYNPIARALNKLFNWSGLLSDLSRFFGSILLHKSSTRVSNFFFAAGVLGLSWKVLHGLWRQYQLWNWVPSHFRNRETVNEQQLKDKYGNCFVVITGCTEGIGLAYALEFAKLGFGLVLVARNKQKLERRVL